MWRAALLREWRERQIARSPTATPRAIIGISMSTIILPLVPYTLTMCKVSGEKFSDKEYWAFCETNRLHRRIERTAEGKVVIRPPAGGEEGYRNTLVSVALF